MVGPDPTIRPPRWGMDPRLKAEDDEKVAARNTKGRKASLSGLVIRIRVSDQSAAVTMNSTLYFGAASLASLVARAGVLAGSTQASQAAFISPK